MSIVCYIKQFILFRAKIGLNTIPERAREELLMTFKAMLSPIDSVVFLLKWSLRHKPDHIDNETSVVSENNCKKKKILKTKN